VAFQCLRVATDTERWGSAGDDDSAHVVSILEVGHHLAVLGVHRAGPGIVAMRSVQPDRADPIVDRPSD